MKIRRKFMFQGLENAFRAVSALLMPPPLPPTKPKGLLTAFVIWPSFQQIWSSTLCLNPKIVLQMLSFGFQDSKMYLELFQLCWCSWPQFPNRSRALEASDQP